MTKALKDLRGSPFTDVMNTFDVASMIVGRRLDQQLLMTKYANDMQEKVTTSRHFSFSQDWEGLYDKILASIDRGEKLDSYKYASYMRKSSRSFWLFAQYVVTKESKRVKETENTTREELLSYAVREIIDHISDEPDFVIQMGKMAISRGSR